MSTVAVATTITDAGITTALVRRPVDPTAGDFRGARRIQSLLAVMMIALAAGVAVTRPGIGLLLLLDSLQLVTDPFVLQPKVMLQRSLDFRGLAAADGLGVLTRAVSSLAIAFYARDALALVAGDLTAAVVTAGAIITVLAPRAPQPAADAAQQSMRTLMAQGSRFQLFTLILTARDLSSSAVIGGVTGLRALGLFQFAYRAMSPVMIVFTSLSQLAIPLGVRVVAGGRSTHQRVRSGYLLSSVATAVLLATIASPAQWLVPTVFGARWSQAVPLVFAMALALVVSGPANSFGVGLLLAANETRLATLAAISTTALFLGLLLGLGSLGGVHACAIAWDVSAVVETIVVVTACHRTLRVSLVSPTIVPIPIFLVAYLGGHLAANATASSLAAIASSAGAAFLISAGMTAAVAWRPARELLRAARDSAPKLHTLPSQP